MGCRAQPVRYPISRTVQQMTREIRMGWPSYTEFRILPISDMLDLRSVTAITDFADLSANHLSQSGANALTTAGAGNTLMLSVVDINTLEAADFLF